VLAYRHHQYHNLALRQFDAIDRAHLRLGTHVRISPNHLSISAPEAVETIYGHGANFLKDIWYDGGAGEGRTMADTRSKAEHQSKRKRMAHLFSQKTVSEMQPVIVDRVLALLQATDDAGRETKALNMRRFVNYFTIDVITYIMFGEPAGCLERGDDLVPAKNPKTGRVYKAPLIDALHDSMRVAVPIGYFPTAMPVAQAFVKFLPMFKSGERFGDIIYYHVTETYNRVEKLQDPGSASFSDGGFLRQIMFDKNGQRRPGLPLAELLAESSGMVNAGSDTTSTALANTVYLLSQEKHRHIKERLQRELEPVFAAAPEPVPSFESLAQLAFLRGCIDETLRLRPSSAFGLPREVPSGGRWVAGQFVAEGVSVSVPTFSLLRSREVFNDPEEYRPERWTDTPASDPRHSKMKKYYLPFSTGPRGCIGRNIAYYEMTLVIATLVHYFDFEFADPGIDGNYKVLERLNANPDELFMIPKRRTSTTFS
jgi:cytochrome P450